MHPFTPALQEFVRLHLKDNTDKLLLNTKKYPDIDIRQAVEQIIARRQIKEKLPAWYINDNIVYPSRISTEQCSSELTARYKQRLICGERLCDLTGGLGVDSFYFSRQAREIVYAERFPDYCQAAEINFKALGATNIRIVNDDAGNLASKVDTDTFYIDPARRAGENKRVFALADCEPDVLQLKPLLLDRAQRLIIKTSPMADIAETLRLLPETTEIHILSVKNECKELLFVLGKEYYSGSPAVYTINYNSPCNIQSFTFTPEEEKNAPLLTADLPGSYLYEPNASLMKGGAFKLIATRLNVRKLHQHSHLYTSGELLPDFPGRVFRIEDTFDFSGKLLKQLSKSIPKANLSVRNFNMNVAELRKRSAITEGGDIYLFATTMGQKQVIIKTRKPETEE